MKNALKFLSLLTARFPVSRGSHVLALKVVDGSEVLTVTVYFQGDVNGYFYDARFEPEDLEKDPMSLVDEVAALLDEEIKKKRI